MRVSPVTVLLIALLAAPLTAINFRPAHAGSYFTLTANPSPVAVNPGSKSISTITITTTGLQGEVLGCPSQGIHLSARVTPNVTGGPTATLSPDCVDLDSTGKASTILTVSASLTTPLGNYAVDIPAVFGCFAPLLCATFVDDVGQVPVVVTTSSTGGITFSEVEFFMGTRTTIQGTLLPDSTGRVLSGSLTLVTTNTTNGNVLFSGIFSVSVALQADMTARFILKEPTSWQTLGPTCSFSVASSMHACFVAKNPSLDGANTVDLASVSIVFRNYGTTSGTPQYNPSVDLNGDGTVTIMDCGIVAADYGAPVFS